MNHNEIIEQTRNAGLYFAELYGHDIHRICEALRQIEKSHDSTIDNTIAEHDKSTTQQPA